MATISPAASTSSPLVKEAVSWEGLSIPVPSGHFWQMTAPDPVQINGVPVLAQGRITFDPAHATNPVEFPDGITFTIVQFSGTADDWLDMARQAAPRANPIEPATIRETTIAGRRALVYSHRVTGVSQSQHYIVPLDNDRLLLIYNSNADSATYQAVLNALVIQQP